MERESERDGVRVSEEMQRGKKTLLLTLEEFLPLFSRDTCMLRSDSSFAFTDLQTNGRANLNCVKDF